MDERQTQIREGAGLEESRLNTDFIELIKKHGPHALILLALLALGYRGYQYLHSRQIERVNNAFLQLEAAGPAETASPEALRTLASEYDGVRGVGILARLRAADADLDAVRRGVYPGAVVKPDGTLESEKDALDEEGRNNLLDEAERGYRTVRERVADKPAMAIHAINALYGLAAVAECKGAMDDAKAFYEEVATVADRHQLAPHGDIARERIATLPTIESAPSLYSQAQLPKLPWEQPPVIPTGEPVENIVGPEQPATNPADQPGDDAAPAGDDQNAGSGGDEATADTNDEATADTNDEANADTTDEANDDTGGEANDDASGDAGDDAGDETPPPTDPG